MKRIHVAIAWLTLPVAVTACSGGDAGGGQEIAVLGTDTACTAATTDVAAGPTTFVFTNNARDVSELYIKSGNKILKEVENITTNATKKLAVTLTAGQTYTITCKPGQQGAGLSTEIRAK